MEECDLFKVIQPFWIWLVKEAKIEVIEATESIEVHGYIEEGDIGAPVITFAELVELYKEKNLLK